MRTSSDYILKAIFTTSGPNTASREQWMELELKSENHVNGLIRLIIAVLKKYDNGELDNYLKEYSNAPWSSRTIDAERIIAGEIATPTVTRAEQE